MNILAVGAHPDDVEIGCGGTLLKMRDLGHNIFILVMTYGDFGGSPEVRVKEQEKSAEHMGVSKVYWGGQKDTKIHVDSGTISLISNTIKDCEADIVFLPHSNDTHQDHRAVARCGITAARYIKRVLQFELPTTVDFSPNIFIDISEYIDKKEETLRHHCSQLNKDNGSVVCLDERVRAFAVFRGLQARAKYVEGFAAHRLSLENF